LAGGNILFVIYCVLAQSLFLNLPLTCVQERLLLGKYGEGDSLAAVLVSVGGSALGLAIGLLIVTAILGGVAKLTAGDGRLCGGRFWIVTTFLLALSIFLIQLYAPDIYVAVVGEANFAQIARTNISVSAKVAIEKLVDDSGFPYKDVYIQLDDEGPNAAYIGLTHGRIVIFQSLVDLLDVRDLCGPIAHEVGHWKHRDSVKILLLLLALIMAFGFALRHFTQGGLVAFGFDSQPVFALVWMAVVTIEAFEFVEMPILNALKRAGEYGADCFAAQRGYPIGNALIILTEATRHEIEASALYEMFYLDHPQLSNRLKHIGSCVNK
jgi:STE24 endopeptidase